GWRGVDPLNLDAPALDTLLPRLRAHIARMTDDDNAADVERALMRLTGHGEGVAVIEYDV
ncbi:MAG TPA: hypothetical protein VGF99_09895, partial [Myxococcota bacterium]